jgi:ketosteroid isomerase-like protein
MVQGRTAIVLLLLLTAIVAGQEPVPAALRAMADTELEFAASAKVKGVRDAFLEFFADDAIAFNPKPISAKERLRARPGQPFSVQELTWEPRTGDVAASGELGWLTGPSTFVDHAGDDKPRYGNYLSVWRKQPDGRWRVFIDVGANLPSPARFPPGFSRFPSGERYDGRQGKEAATASLAEADRDLNDRIGANGASAAFGDRLRSAARLHRHGMLPLMDRAEILSYLEQNVRSMRASHGRAEAADSGDFGYSYGMFEISAQTPQTGAYVRLWTRDRSGRWWVVVDAVG